MVRLQSSSFKFESMSKPLLVIWKSLLKATPEYIHRFWFTFDWKINGRALGAALWHSLDKSGWQEQTQSVSQVCQVGGSCCWQQQALFKMRKTCYHSCNNWPVLESNLFWWPGFVNFWQWLLLFFFFFIWNICWNFWWSLHQLCKNLLLPVTKAAVIAQSFNHTLVSEYK